MTVQEMYALFSKAMNEKRIIRYDNNTSRDDYHTYAIRKTQSGYLFFCLLETFFKTTNNSGWLPGSLKSYHEFAAVKGATTQTLYLTSEQYTPVKNFNEKLPKLITGEESWITVV